MSKAKIGSVSDIATKWSTVTSGRSSDYEAGVKNPKADWETNTVAAAASYKTAVSASDIQKKFSGGVKKVGTEKWQEKASTLGKDRFATGVAAAKDDYQAGFEPYATVIAATELSDRQPRGSTANYQRVQQIGAALTAKRVALKTAGA